MNLFGDDLPIWHSNENEKRPRMVKIRGLEEVVVIRGT